jgi:hypothetical protein
VSGRVRERERKNKRSNDVLEDMSERDWSIITVRVMRQRDHRARRDATGETDRYIQILGDNVSG